MTNPVYFTVEADYRAVVQDIANDGDYDPQIVPVSATVTFTPMLDRGSVILATGASPRPTGFLGAPITAIIDGVDGRLKLRTQGEAGNPGGYTYTPVRLLANSPLLELATPLYYSVAFTNVTFFGKPGSIAGFEFEAPNGDTTINLIDLAYAPGQPPTGITKIAPGGVRLDGDNIVFTFGGADIPNPIPTSIFTGPTGSKGDKGDAATISVGDVTTLEPGSAATVTNEGTTGDALLAFGIPAGVQGDVGPIGPRGYAATVDVGTVTTVASDAPAAVTNTGTENDAVLAFDIPQGVKGDKGDAATVTVGDVTTLAPGSSATVSNSGTSGDAVFDFGLPQGAAATVTVGSVSTGNAGSSASVTNTGTTAEAVLAFQIPRGDKGDKGDAATITVGTVSTGAPGSSASFTNVGDSHDAVFEVVIPRGDVGATGSKGDKGDTGNAATVSIGTVTTLPPGSSASVTNVGTSGAAILDIAIPKGDTGSADATEWASIPNKPAVVAAGTNKADARASIDAAYTGDIGQPNGMASLDSAGKVPVSQLPNSVMTFEGLVDVAGNSPALSDATGNAGQVYRVSVGGTRNYGSGNITANVGDYLIHSGSVWQVADGTDAISSVNGYTGTVTLTKADIGLSAVNNTADLDKPISTATQSALDGKEPVIGAGTSGQYWSGTKTWATLNKSAVGLGSVDNTADLDKPISNATQTALNAKEPTITGGTSAQYWTGLKSWATLDKTAVGLGSVDNTADANKNVLSATKLTTARTIDGQSFNGTADITVIAPGTTAATSKATPVDADELPLVDSAASSVLKKLTWANLKATLKTYFDSVNTALTNKDLTSATNTFPTFNQNTTGTAALATNLVASTTTAVQLGTVELGHASDTTLSRSAAGTLAVEGVNLVKTTDSRLSDARTPTAAGQVADLSIVAFGANTARAASSYGDFPFGVKLQRAVTLTSVTYRVSTADASGNLVVELRKNGSTVSGSSATIAAASQVAGGTATGTWSFAAGDIVTIYITGVGTTPGKGLIADITGVTT